jgi:predicted nucleotidyltransferase
MLGDYVPGQSDVDLLLIVDRPLRRAEIDRLARAVTGERTHAAGPVDVRVITHDVAATPLEIPPMELYVRFELASPRRSLHTTRGSRI